VVDHCNDRDTALFSDQYCLLSDPKWDEWLLDQTRGFEATLLLTGGMENQPEILAQLEGMRSLVSVPRRAIQQCRDVANWQYWCHSAQIHFPDSIFPHKYSDWESSRLLARQRSWLVKNTNGAGGLQVRRLPSDRDAFDLAMFAKNLSTTEYLQEVLDGPTIGATFLSSQHGVILIGAMVNETIGPNHFMPEFTYSGSSGPVGVSEEEKRRLIQLGQIVTSKSGLVGLWQVDFLRRQTGLHLLEINPRWSASMELFQWLWQLPLTHWHARCVRGCVTNDEWSSWSNAIERNASDSNKKSGRKTIAYSKDTFEVTNEQSEMWFQHRWHCLSESPETHKVPHGYADIPRPGTIVHPTQPILTQLEMRFADSQT
jgi:uncharacterized protein